MSDSFWKLRLHSPWTIAALAVVAWGAIFLTPGAKFWDDWVAFNDDTLRMTSELGAPWTGYTFYALAALGPWAFKVLILACTITVGIAVTAISGRGFDLSHRERWLLGALVVTMPFFTIRMLASVNTYSWSVALFFVAWYLLVRKPAGEGGVVRYIAAALLFFVSYTTGSLLVFTLLPVAHLAFLEMPRTGSFIRNVLRFAGRFWYVLAAPVLFWIVRAAFFTPYGIYENYNSFGALRPPFTIISLSAFAMIGLFVAALAILLFHQFAPIKPWLRRSLSLGAGAIGVAAIGVFLLLTRVATTVPSRVMPYTVLICALILGAIALREFVYGARGRAVDSSRRSVAPMVAAGIAAFTVGLLPYLLVGKLPTYQNWESRHQLLLPLGIAIIFLGVVRALGTVIPTVLTRWVAVVTLAVFTTASLFVSLALVADWNKQMQITAALSESDLVRDSSTVVFVDNTSALSFDGRGFPFYELNGWLITAFGDQKRIGLNRAELGSFLDNSTERPSYAASRYGYGEFVPSTDGVLVEIDRIAGAGWFGLLLDQPSVDVRITHVDDLESLR